MIKTQLARRMDGVAPSATLALAEKAKQLQAQGLDVVSLTAGEPDRAPAEPIIEALCAAAKAGHTRYTAVSGIEPLREAIAADLLRRDGLSFATGQVVVSTGAKQAIFNALQALVDPGDEVVFAAPYWLSYRDMALLAGGVPVVIETAFDDGFVLRPDALDRSLGPKSKVLILNSPSNPTGGAYRRADFEAIAEVLRRHPGVFVVADEIYRRFIYEAGAGEGLLGVAPNLQNRTLVIDGCSKTYAMTGLRIGWAAGPKPVIAAVAMLQGQSTSNPCSTSQHAALAALTGDQSWVDEMVATFDRRRQKVLELLSSIPGLRTFAPLGAFYVFPDVSGLVGRKTPSGQVISDGTSFASYLLESHQLTVVPGAPFGAANHIRLSYATGEATIEKGLERLAAAVTALS